MYSCKGSCHPVRMAHTSAAELFHQSSRLVGLLHSGNLSLRQQMHQTATKKTTHSANHQNIMGIFSQVHENIHLKALYPVCVNSDQKKPYCKHIKYLWNVHYALTQFYWPIKLYFYKDTIHFIHTIFSTLPTIFNSQSEAFILFF